MSLTSSMYTATSGLSNLGSAMQIIGDNISNMNTVAFKGDDYSFEDLLSQVISTQSGTEQVGSGVALSSVSPDFSQGSYETTGNTTDMAIGGDGFFVVRDPNSQQEYYTRAGNFTFNNDGYLTNSQGDIVQGWALNSSGQDTGAVTDIRLSSYTSPPQASSKVTMITNLDSSAISQSAVLSNQWDGTASTPISSSSYVYQSVAQVYDSLGSTHDLTVYYQPDPAGNNTWDYLVTCAPSEDQRNLVQGTAGQGLLARGTITFNPTSGTITDMTMSQFSGLVGNVSTIGTLTPSDATFTVNNYGAITATNQGLTLTYDPTATTQPGFVNGWYPSNSSLMTILPTSNASVVNIGLNGDTTPDLTLNLTSAAQTGDSVSFDINDPTDINVQSINNVTYGPTSSTGTTTVNNTTMTIDDPGALTADDNGFSNNGIELSYDTTTGWSLPTYGTGNGFSASAYKNFDVSGDANEVQVIDTTTGDPIVTYTFTQPLTADSTINFDVTGTSAWTTATQTQPDANGYYQLDTNFLGGGQSTDQPIEFDIGTHSTGTGSWTDDSLTTTEYSRASATTYQKADGYAAGDLQSVAVSTKGSITGSYSNGQLIPLYQVALAKFQDNDGLLETGGNLYQETVASGAAITNQPGTSGLGTISPNSLEQSNVDVSKQFVGMISTQQAFDANSKIVTTVDRMLSTAVGMIQ